jgi:hypothetical protein
MTPFSTLLPTSRSTSGHTAPTVALCQGDLSAKSPTDVSSHPRRPGDTRHTRRVAIDSWADQSALTSTGVCPRSTGPDGRRAVASPALPCSISCHYNRCLPLLATRTPSLCCIVRPCLPGRARIPSGSAKPTGIHSPAGWNGPRGVHYCFDVLCPGRGSPIRTLFGVLQTFGQFGLQSLANACGRRRLSSKNVDSDTPPPKP